jgi:hypothetical protein
MNGSSKLAIHLAFTKGISCNGKRIKKDEKKGINGIFK